MAIHSSTIAWKIPWTEEPCRLQSMGSQKVGQDWATSLSLSLTEWVSEVTQLCPIFPTQGLNLGLPHFRQTLYQLSQQGSYFLKGFPGGASSKEPACQYSRLKWGRFNPWVYREDALQHSCLEDPMDRGPWWGQAISSQRVRHNWSNLAYMSAYFLKFYIPM